MQPSALAAEPAGGDGSAAATQSEASRARAQPAEERVPQSVLHSQPKKKLSLLERLALYDD